MFYILVIDCRRRFENLLVLTIKVSAFSRTIQGFMKFTFQFSQRLSISVSALEMEEMPYFSAKGWHHCFGSRYGLELVYLLH